MGRILLLLLAALGAALYFPESREQVLDRAQPLLNPAYAWMTRGELSQMVSDLELVDRTSAPFPAGRGEFDAWLDRRYPREPSRVDAWGTRYRLEVVGNAFHVISAGPDREFGTEDDLRRTGQRTGRGR